MFFSKNLHDCCDVSSNPVIKNFNTLSEADLKVTLPCGCNQGIPPSPEMCICSTFAQVCNPVGTVATVMRIFKCEISSQQFHHIKWG